MNLDQLFQKLIKTKSTVNNLLKPNRKQRAAVKKMLGTQSKHRGKDRTAKRTNCVSCNIEYRRIAGKCVNCGMHLKHTLMYHMTEEHLLEDFPEIVARRERKHKRTSIVSETNNMTGGE